MAGFVQWIHFLILVFLVSVQMLDLPKNTPLYLRLLVYLFLALPPGVSGRVRTAIFCRTSLVFGPVPAWEVAGYDALAADPPPHPHPWQSYGKGADTETPQAGAGSLSFCWFSGFLGRFPWVSGRVSYPLGLF